MPSDETQLLVDAYLAAAFSVLTDYTNTHARSEDAVKAKSALDAHLKISGEAGEAAMDAFHKHLDHCRQCRENPMALCSTGAWLLERAAIRALGANNVE